MQSESPNWYKLIHYWCEVKTPKGYGLTLPFIIGATGYEDINHLLSDISNNSMGEYIIISYCYDLNEYVLRIDDSHYPVAEYLSGQGHLLYDDDNIESLQTFNDVIRFLEDRYSSHITAGEYSKNMATGFWGPFSEKDLAHINSVL